MTSRKPEEEELIHVDYRLAYYRWSSIAFANMRGWSEPHSRAWFLKRLEWFFESGKWPAMAAVTTTISAELLKSGGRSTSEGDDEYLAEKLGPIIVANRNPACGLIYPRVVEFQLKRDARAARDCLLEAISRDKPDRAIGGSFAREVMLSLGERASVRAVLKHAEARDLRRDDIDWSGVRKAMAEDSEINEPPVAPAQIEFVQNRVLMEQMVSRLVARDAPVGRGIEWVDDFIRALEWCLEQPDFDW